MALCVITWFSLMYNMYAVSCHSGEGVSRLLWSLSVSSLNELAAGDRSKPCVPPDSAGESSLICTLQPRDRCFLNAFHLEYERKQEAQ